MCEASADPPLGHEGIDDTGALTPVSSRPTPPRQLELWKSHEFVLARLRALPSGGSRCSWRALDVARIVAPKGDTVCGCGCRPLPEGISIYRREHEGADPSYSVGGAMTCGGVWRCPLCLASDATKRADTLARYMRAWITGGLGMPVFVTLTASHGAYDEDAETIDALAAGRRAVTVGSSGAALRKLGVTAMYSAGDVTLGGQHGSHPHLHCIAFVSGDLDCLSEDGEAYRAPSPERIGRIRDRIARRWRAGVAKHGRTADDDHGCRVEIPRSIANSAAYVAGIKAKLLADEVASGAKSKGRSVHGILFAMRDLAHDGRDAEAMRLARCYQRWCAASKGRRRSAWWGRAALDAALEAAHGADVEEVLAGALLDERDDAHEAWIPSRWWAVATRTGMVGALLPMLWRAGEWAFSGRSRPPPEVVALERCASPDISLDLVRSMLAQYA